MVSGLPNLSHVNTATLRESNNSDALAKKATALASSGEDDKQEIRRLSEQFEAIFLEIVLKSMRDSVQKSNFINGGNGEEIFRTMLDSEYAKSMASQRTSGLASTIENQLLNLMGQTRSSNSGQATQSLERKEGLARYSAAGS